MSRFEQGVKESVRQARDQHTQTVINERERNAKRLREEEDEQDWAKELLPKVRDRLRRAEEASEAALNLRLIEGGGDATTWRLEWVDSLPKRDLTINVDCARGEIRCQLFDGVRTTDDAVDASLFNMDWLDDLIRKLCVGDYTWPCLRSTDG